jgi:hypothetical protein
MEKFVSDLLTKFEQLNYQFQDLKNQIGATSSTDDDETPNKEWDFYSDDREISDNNNEEITSTRRDSTHIKIKSSHISLIF